MCECVLGGGGKGLRIFPYHGNTLVAVVLVWGSADIGIAHERLVDVVAAKLVELAVGVEDDERNLALAQHAQLIGLLHQPALAFLQRHLSCIHGWGVEGMSVGGAFKRCHIAMAVCDCPVSCVCRVCVLCCVCEVVGAVRWPWLSFRPLPGCPEGLAAGDHVR